MYDDRFWEAFWWDACEDDPAGMVATLGRSHAAKLWQLGEALFVTPPPTNQLARAVQDRCRRLPVEELARLCDLVRCLVGNPFRDRPAFAPAWRTAVAVALAKQAHDLLAFDRLPILADALEEAGCDAAELLAHLRGPGPHARGCWAVGLVLGSG